VERYIIKKVWFR